MLVDIAIIVLITIFALKYYKRGFAASLLRIARLLGSTAASILFGGWLSAILYELFVKNAVSKAVSSIIFYVEADNFDGFIQVVNYFSDLDGASNAAGIDPTVISESISAPIAYLLSEALAHAVVFFLIFVLFSALIKGVKMIKTPVFNGIDSILGASFGLSLGIVVSFIAITAVYTALVAANSFFGVGGELLSVFNESLIFKYVYNSGSQGILDGLL